ncbi:MAG: HDIG domain-containing protein, partial [Myxococcaceae bacterium]|nr:HDIG domain-containing protein [Myxococcaceae bacterium]
DVLTHTGLLLERLPERTDPALGWGALLHDVGKPATARAEGGRISFHRHEHVGAEMADAIARRLRFANELREAVVGLVGGHMRFFSAPAMRPSTLKRFLRTPEFPQALALHRADLLASSGDLATWEFCRDQLAALPPEQLHPVPLLRGEDVIALGVPRGPRVGEVLRALEDAQLEGRVASREAAVALVARWRDGTPPGTAEPDA